MANSPWYREGTAKFTQGSTTVTGTGTRWVDFVRAGDGIQGPDGKLYQVMNVASNTSLSISPAYGSESAYWTIPIQGYVKRLADAASQLVRDFGGGAVEAVDAANRAVLAETRASDSADAASGFKETAEAMAQAASASAVTANAAKGAAKSSETVARDKATDATTKANEASASAVLAEQHKLAAEGHKNQAGVFATNLSDSVNTSGAFSVDSLTASVRSMIHSLEAQEIINHEHTSSTQSSSTFRERLADKDSPIQGAALVGYEGKTVRSALQYLYSQLDTLFGSLKFTNLTAQESVTIPVMGSSFVNVTLNSPECLINFLLLPEYETTDALRELNLRLVQGTGVNRVVWGPNVLWSYGRAPTLSYEKDYFDMIKLITLDNGVTWIGSFEGGWFHEE